jgi:hypothetical protein
MSRVRIPPNPLRYRLFSEDSIKKIGDRKRVNPNGCVATETEMPTTLETTTDSWMLFLYALKAPATRARRGPETMAAMAGSGEEKKAI